MDNIRRIVAFSLIAFAATALAHHNTGAYFDTEQEFTIEGVIDEVQWRNPHVYFTIEGTSDGGEVDTWRIEAGPTGIMRRLDWDKNTLRSGDAVTVVANPSRRDGIKSGYLVSVASDGKAYPSLRGEEAIQRLTVAEAAAGAQAEGLSGVWITLANMEYYSKITDDENLPLTEKGLASQESFDELTNAPALECIPSVAPAMMTIPDTKLIAVDKDTIRIRGEFYNSERTIFLDAADAPTEPTLHGRSIGRWEGDKLVVETDLFAWHRTGVLFGVESSPQKTLVEEFRLGDDGTSLIYSFVMEDPEMMTEPLAADIEYTYRPDIEYESLPCDLENSRQYLHD